MLCIECLWPHLNVYVEALILTLIIIGDETWGWLGLDDGAGDLMMG